MSDLNNRHRCPHVTCYRTYNSAKNLRRHMRAFHSETAKYLCSHCGKQLASSQNLREHIYLHTGEMPYSCGFPGCSRQFRQGSQLSAHRKTHEAVRPSVFSQEFKELRVSFSQLTTLPGLASVLHDELFVPSFSTSAIGLPLLTGEEQIGPLPRLLALEEDGDGGNFNN